MPVVFPSGLAPLLRSARVIAVIPARYKSSRLPGKPLALIQGRPMIQHVHERASDAGAVDAVVVATDDARVAEVVSGFGGVAVMTRGDHATGTDRLAEVAEAITADVIVNVQGDEPLMAAEAIDATVRLVLDAPDERMGTVRRVLDDPEEFLNPAVVKVTVDRHGYALYFSRAPIPHARAGNPAPTIWKHLGLYAYRREFLLTIARLPETPLERAESLEQLRVLEHGFRIRTVETTIDTIGVDTPDDLERVRQRLSPAVPT